MFNNHDTSFEVLYDPIPHYYFSKRYRRDGSVIATIDCSRCKEPLIFEFSWKEITEGLKEDTTKFYGDCTCGKVLTFVINKETIQGFTAESVVEAFKDT